MSQVIAAADAAGLPYWGVAQAFDDANWRWPTPAEEGRMLTQWALSKQRGYMAFAWTWQGNDLTSRPRLLRVLRLYNKGVAPNTSITARPPSVTTKRRAAFHFESSVPGSTFQCELRPAPLLGQVRLSEALRRPLPGLSHLPRPRDGLRTARPDAGPAQPVDQVGRGEAAVSAAERPPRRGDPPRPGPSAARESRQ